MFLILQIWVIVFLVLQKIIFVSPSNFRKATFNSSLFIVFIVSYFVVVFNHQNIFFKFSFLKNDFL